MTKLTDIPGASEAFNICDVCNGVGWYAQQVSYTEQEQIRCENCNGDQDGLHDIHLEVDVEAIDIEALAAETHKIYCDAYEKRFGKPFWTNGDYSKLDEPTKEYDRHFVRWAIKRFLVDYSKWSRMVRK